MYYEHPDGTLYTSIIDHLKPDCQYLIEKVPLSGSVYHCSMNKRIFIEYGGCPKDCEYFNEREINEYD